MPWDRRREGGEPAKPSPEEIIGWINAAGRLDAQGREDEAISLLRRAADAGDADGAALLGMMLFQRGAEDDGEAWLQRAALAGHVKGCLWYGLLLKKRGEWTAAVPWLKQAAEAGDVLAAFSLGMSLISQPQEAEPWFRKAAEAGHHAAMHFLGQILMRNGDVIGGMEWIARAGPPDAFLPPAG
ncbi:tetratricopeptide repeat protein [Yinghuangia seranimata]|uniref:tetratricopeptide repeat protein n=1 Tax=Yinghuangia seranimata TaxID=408067 RepID=UPI00248CB790|nr:tetratricopeptide repeat protein [Yinghuangia seranimata]MDI2130386.1 tetratricopeptide repeat protein [Yinghuangia seranimata]